MPDLPRHPDYDRLIATEGLSPERAAVYGDWLLRQGLTGPDRWLTDDHRIEVVRRLQPHSCEHCELMWCGNLIAGINVAGEFDTLEDRMDLLKRTLSDSASFLLQQLRVELSTLPTDDPREEGTTRWLSTHLAKAPPTLGRLEICDPDVFRYAPDRSLLFSTLETPWLTDLRLRVSRVEDVPRLKALRRLEVFMSNPRDLEALDLSALKALYIWTDETARDASFLVPRAPHLELLGLYGGSLKALQMIPASVQTLVVWADEHPDVTKLQADVPSTVRHIVLHGFSPAGPLSGRLRGSGDEDHPFPPPPPGTLRPAQDTLPWPA